MADDVSIVVRVRDATSQGISSVNRSLTRLADSTKDTDKSFGSMASTAISLAPALIPFAASVAPLAAGLGAAGLAAGVFAAAMGPQIKAMGEAADAEKKYTEAVEKSGAASTQAAAAEKAYLAAVEELPPATREAAASLSVLKDTYADWSDELAGDTMPVATKSFAVFGALFPKLTPMVKGTSKELDRFITIAGAGVQSQAFDRFMQSFSDFATTSMGKANTALVAFTRNLDGAKVGGGVSEFMQFAKESGPLVGDVLMNLGEALTNLLVAAADTGVGMLTLINAFAGLVASVPPELLTCLLQLALAFKAVKIAAAGMAAASVAMVAVRTQITAAGVAAIGAGTRMGMLTLAFAALSRGAKLAVIGTGVGLLLVTLMELSDIGKSTPPNVDKLTSSLGQFARSGQVSGEAARVFGKDLGSLVLSLNAMGKAGESADDYFKRFNANPTSLKEARVEVDALDKSLASMVSGGKGDLAAAALTRIKSEMAASGLSTVGLTDKLTEYKDALADAAFEQQVVADSMGLFGDQAVKTQAKLDAQKRSADGLRQSLQALNDANRQGLGGMIAFEGALDATTKAMQASGEVLSMSNGQLNLNSEAARTAATALNDLASKTDEAAAQARQSGQSWETVNGIYDRGRTKLIAAADAMGLTKTQARQLADQILKTPDKTARLKGNLEDLKAKLSDAKQRLKNSPDSKTAKLKGDIADLQRKVRAAKDAIAGVKGKTVSVMVEYRSSQSSDFLRSIGGYAHGGVIGAAGGGPRSRRTLVGEQGPEIVDLAPGSRVRSNPDTKRLLAGGTAGGGGAPTVVQLVLDGRQLAEVLIDPMRGVIQGKGGSVQAVLGQPGR